MPKVRKIVSKGQTKAKVNVQRKHRIGTRKNGKAAEQMSTTDLIAVLGNDNLKKWHKNAAKVLRTRPINI